MDKSTWTLAELAADTEVAPRTIRYYIARGLLVGPDTAGRGAVYSRHHLERLLEIKRLQAGGRMLAEIAQADAPAELPQPVAWYQFDIADGVTVNVRADLAPWRAKQVRQVLADCAAKLTQEEQK
jgi:DNA-binding transcriptional MerR regulator